jgi:hypothetical protein
MAGMLILFTVYLFAHIGNFLLLRRYVHYILTSVLAIPYSIYAWVKFNNTGYLVRWDTLAWTAIMLVIWAPTCSLCSRWQNGSITGWNDGLPLLIRLNI